jgi:uncharacterized protein (DUF488 family)
VSAEFLTIGHSTHGEEQFVGLLRAHDVTAVADVRSTPYSRRNPQFNRERLRGALKANGIEYVFLGKELGARSEDECCYRDDKVQYALLARTPLFASGLARLIAGSRSYRISLMCAEHEPLECHRSILVARNLVRAGARIAHILRDGSLEPHGQTVERLVKRLHLGSGDLLESCEQAVEAAYDKQAERIAFERPARN